MLSSFFKNQIYRHNGISDVLKIALPMIISTASHSVIVFCDRLFLSKLSIETLAASMPAGLSVFVFLSFFFGLTGYVNALSSQYYGAKKYSRCGLTVWQGIYISIIAYFILILFIPAGKFFFELFKLDSRIIKYAELYYSILMFGSIFTLLDNTISSFFSSIGETKIIMYANISGMLINIPLNYLFIFGLPQNNLINYSGSGIKGAAIASVISTFVCLIILLSKFFDAKHRQKFGTLKECRIDTTIIKKLFQYGGHSGVELLLNISAFNFFVFIIGSIGIIEQSAVNITFSWNLLAFLPLIGISIATTSLVGKNIGSKNISGAETAIFSSLKIAYFYMFFLVMAYLFFPEMLVKIFCTSKDASFSAVFDLSVKMLRFITVYMFTDVILVILAGALRGAGDTKFIMVTSALMHWFCLVLPAAAAVYYWKANVINVWFIFIIFSIALMFLYLFRFLGGKWKTINIIEPGEQVINIAHLSSEIMIE